MTRDQLDIAAAAFLRDDAESESLLPSAVLALLRQYAESFVHTEDAGRLIVLSAAPSPSDGSVSQFACVLPNGDLFGPKTLSGWGSRIGNLFTGNGGRLQTLLAESALAGLSQISLRVPDVYLCLKENTQWVAGLPARISPTNTLRTNDSRPPITSVRRHATVFSREQHGLVVGDWVASLDAAYAPLTRFRSYYVTAATANTFRLSEYPGGPTIQLASGDHDTIWHVLPCLTRLGPGGVPDDYVSVVSTSDPNLTTTAFYPAAPTCRYKLYVSSIDLSWWLWDHLTERYVRTDDRSNPPLVWDAPFTAIPTTNPYAVDVSGQDATSELLVTLAPPDDYHEGSVIVYDATAACTDSRRIVVKGRINATDDLEVVMNAAAASLQFDVVGGTVGWRVSLT